MTLKSLNFTLLVVNVDNETLPSLSDTLNKKCLMAPGFFALAPMVVNIGEQSLEIDFLQLKQTVEEQGFILTGITGNVSELHKQQAAEHSIAVLHSSGRQVAPTQSVPEQKMEPLKGDDGDLPIEPATTTNCAKTKMHIGRVRSGQQIYAKECDLVITGDVGAGAEVIADGNIHVYGALCGKALAGAAGNRSAAIFCQALEPELISIAGVYKLSEALPPAMWSTACSVSLEDQNMVFANLNKI